MTNKLDRLVVLRERLTEAFLWWQQDPYVGHEFDIDESNRRLSEILDIQKEIITATHEWVALMPDELCLPATAQLKECAEQRFKYAMELLEDVGALDEEGPFAEAVDPTTVSSDERH